MNLFMNKNNGSYLKFKLRQIGKSPTPHLKTLWYDVNHAKKLKTTPFAICEIKLFNLYKSVHTHYQKNK
jgi:hypothetical protein